MSVSKNLENLREKINNISFGAKRDSSLIKLVAVSKKQPAARVREALDAGHRIFGENRVQEALERWRDSGWRDEFDDLCLHLIGPLQTNKVADAVALFDVVETLDREKLAKALMKEMDKQGRHLPCFIQVNTGEEAQKAGVAPSDLGDFYDFCVQECGLNVTGLMCLPPLEEPPALHFAFLQKLAGQFEFKHLSMGMSADFEKAVPLGATYIRVGTGVFGAREVL